MIDACKTWQSGWGARLADHLRSAGYRDVLEFMKDNPGKPYKTLAKMLGPDVAPIQLSSVFLRTALAAGKFREAAYDSLIRELTDQLREGWGGGPNPDFPPARAWSAWITSLTVEAGVPSIEPVAMSVWEELKKDPPPLGWKPGNDADEVIRRAFDVGWPEAVKIPAGPAVDEFPGY
jgi:hypothetical protein